MHFKPIFHQNGNPFILKLCVWYDPQWELFGLLIPTCCYLKSHLYPMSWLAVPAKSDLQLEWVECGGVGLARIGACVGHVDFMLSVSFPPVLLPNTNAVFD